MKRRAAAELDPQSPASSTPAPNPPATVSFRDAHRPGPHSREEAEAQYVTARDTWTKAMHAANSGRSADLASLALAQEAYELAAAERERWLAARVTVRIDPPETRRNLEIAVGQELAWRDIHQQPQAVPSFIQRLRRRLGGK